MDEKSLRLIIPAGSRSNYRLAQLDDYMELSRSNFLWEVPFQFSISAKISSADVEGTWGFGFWNDPFNIGLGIKGTARRFPILPNAIWFFYASKQNYLSLQDSLSPNGFLAAIFTSENIHNWLFVPGIIFSPLLMVPLIVRIFRKMLRSFIKEDNLQLNIDPTQWHQYEIRCNRTSSDFIIDNKMIFTSKHVPNGKLGCVIWVDNQYAALPPDGRVTFGSLRTNDQLHLEVSDIKITKLSVSSNK